MSEVNQIKNVGSLKQFIDIPIMVANTGTNITTKTFKKQYTQKYNRSMLSHHHNLKQSSLQNKNQKRRVKTVLSQYQASSKSPEVYKKKYGNFPEDNEWKQDYKVYEKNSFKKLSRSGKKGSKDILARGMMFPRRQYLMEFVRKNRPRPQETLLRCFQKIQQSQQNTKDDQNYQTFDKIKNKYSEIYSSLEPHSSQMYEPSNFNKKQYFINLKGSQTSKTKKQSVIIYNRSQRKGQGITSKKRIQFQHCLSWAKKHKKNGGYYQKELGKNKKQIKLIDSERQRKKLMKQLYGFYDLPSQSLGMESRRSKKTQNTHRKISSSPFQK